MKKQIKQKNRIKDNYTKCRTFLAETKPQIKFTIGLFICTFLIGFIFPIFFVEEIKAFVEQMLASLQNLSPAGLIGFILFNNIKASFFAMITGVAFAIFPLITVVLNGYLLGFISRSAVSAEGIFILWRLLPHGIFELPAIILSIAIGIKLGSDVFKKKNKRSIPENIKESLRCFIFIIIPLLILAAIIEGLLISIVG